MCLLELTDGALRRRMINAILDERKEALKKAEEAAAAAGAAEK